MKRTFYSLLILILIFVAQSNIFAQINHTSYPQGYFRNPLDIPIQLAANFGEIRGNHFHMGLDIRTQGKENLPVYSAANGYISHIRIEKYGYGHAIFVTHPNGYTTLYGHLNNFFPALQAYLENKQYNDKNWEQDFDLQPNQFPVSKGDFIAFSGNTGHSQGPHLHFEIRDAKTGNNLNPELFGFDITDTIPPVISAVYLYSRQYSTYLVPPLQIKKTDTIITSNRLVSIGISAEDKSNTSSYKYGIYQAELWMDDSLLINAFTMDNFSYTDSRYINASIDYSKYIIANTGIQYLFALPGNALSIFSSLPGNGLIILQDTLPHTIEIFVRDASSNISSRSFILKYDPALQKTYPFPANATTCIPGKINTLQTANAKIQFSENAFYDTVPFVLTEQISTQANQASCTIILHNNSVPVHDAFSISIKTNLAAGDPLRDKIIMQLSSGDESYLRQGNWQGDWMTAQFRNLGTARLLIDTIAPVILSVNWKNGTIFTGTKNIVLRCTDNLGELTYFTALLDDDWLLFSQRSDYFTYKFDAHCMPGPHQLTVTAIDIAGNTSTKIFTFIKK